MKNKKHIITYILIIIALIAFIVIGKKNFVIEEKVENKITHKYNILDVDNVFEKITSSQTLTKIHSGNALIFMGFNDHKQSEYYASLLNDVAKSLNIEKIYYYDFYNDRKKSNATYETIVNELTNYLYTNDEGKVNLEAPTFIIIKNYNIIYFDSDASKIQANLSEEDYWNDYNTSLKKLSLEIGLKNYLGE